VRNSCRSSAFYLVSSDQKYIIKSCSAGEIGTLKRILPAYFTHMAAHRDSLMTAFLGGFWIQVGESEPLESR
jgi:1-phosphatidylinositol-4-phosphate 5-kinase